MNTQEQELINNYLATNTVTTCPTQYNTKDKGSSTKDTIGDQVTTMATPINIYNDDEELIGIKWEATSWINGMNLKAHLNHIDMLPTLKKTNWFRLRLLLQRNKTNRTNRQIRRNIAREKNIISKKGTTTKYKKRAIPTPPSKQA